MRAKKHSTRTRPTTDTANGRANGGRRVRASRRATRRRRRTTSGFATNNFAYDAWRQQARPAIRQAARDWRSSPLFDVAEEIRVEVQDQIRNMIPDIVLREVRGVLHDVTTPYRRRRTRTA